ncbi:kinase-like protein [Acephala macrosclerotiorum]|nr:kinase-like protein [Acephala macrosclerotiorum]
MEEPNTIAWLSPVNSESHPEGKYAWEAIRMNISEDIPPQREMVSDYRSRESTASLEDAEDNTPDDTSYPRLQLAFNCGRKSGHGLMFGTAPNCDIVLPRLRKISQHHCYFTFDAERRLILRDCSTHGTIVSYDDKGGELRRHFTWILGGHDVPRRTKEIVIEIQGVSFRIEVSRHDGHPDQYNANVDRFLKEADEPHLNELGICSPTAPPSQSHTPNQSAIRLKQETLGKGAFAVVRRYWDVSTGIEYAYKEPLNKRKFDHKSWEKEAEIMGQISHDYVVSLIESTLKPSPRLVLEYVPCGNLEGLELSLEESMMVLYQGLSALVDLHGREIPIVHRDIKPGNILLQSIDPLHIKLTDFGLSKASDDLTTLCGTPLYLAPEVYKKRSYTPAVDIWSLGVVAFRCAYSLPDNRGYEGRDWCKMLVDQVNDWEDGDLIGLLSSAMIVMDPKLRLSAQDCYREASQLITASHERCLTPTPTSYHTDEGHVPPPSSGASTIIANLNSDPQRVESVPGIDLFGEGWLQDPNCVGSSVAAMGQESSDLSSWDNWATESSGERVPRSMPEPEQNEYYDPPVSPGRGGGEWGRGSKVVKSIIARTIWLHIYFMQYLKKEILEF